MTNKLDMEAEIRKANAKRKQQDEELMFHCAYVADHEHAEDNADVEDGEES